MTATVTVSRLLKARVEEVFDAWTDPEQLREWLVPMPGTVGEISATPVVGGTYRIVTVGADGAYEVNGEYLEIDPPHRLVFTWRSDGTGGETRVTVTLRPDGEATDMTIVHERLSTPATATRAPMVWGRVVDLLDRHLTQRA